jgi:release factor glutamine methyltransferase
VIDVATERTVPALLTRGAAVLEAAGIGPARAEAEWLLAGLLDVERFALYLDPQRRLASPTVSRYLAQLERRAAREPLQYLLGWEEFHGLRLAVTPDVLVPRPETEGLVEAVLETLHGEIARWRRPRVVDLGTGSGAIALAVASEFPGAVVTATDASRAALEVAESNARDAGLADGVRFVHGEWFASLAPDERFEVVISNPPYIAEHEWSSLPVDVRREPRSALISGEDGLDATRQILDDAPRHLVAGGLLALELDEARAEEVEAWLDGAHEWESVELRDDLAGRPRVLLARRARGPAIAPLQWPEEG